MEHEIEDNQQIANVIKAIETANNVIIIYACESGSRAHNVATKNSDHDLKGFYMLHKANPKLTYDTSKVRGLTKIFPPYPTPIDYEFVETNLMIQSILEGNATPLRWMFAPMVYINKGKIIKDNIVALCSPPHEEILQRIKKDVLKVNNNVKREASKWLNMVIDTMMLIWMQSKNTYPAYDAHQLLNSLHDIIGDDKHNQLKEQITTLLYSKKNGKPTTVDDWLIKLVQDTIFNEEAYLKTFTRKTIGSELAKSLMIKYYIVTLLAVILLIALFIIAEAYERFDF